MERKMSMRTRRGEVSFSYIEGADVEGIVIDIGDTQIGRIELRKGEEKGRFYTWDGVEEDYQHRTDFSINPWANESTYIQGICEDIVEVLDNQGARRSDTEILKIAYRVAGEFENSEYVSFIEDAIGKTKQ